MFVRSVLLSAPRWARLLWSDVVVRTRETYPSIERLLRSLKAPTRHKRKPYHNLAVSFELLGNGFPPRRMNHCVGCTLLSVLLFLFSGRTRVVFLSLRSSSASEDTTLRRPSFNEAPK